MEDMFRKLNKKDLSKISEQKLLEDMKEYIGLQLKSRSGSNICDPFLFAAERKLLKGLEKTDLDVGKAYEILTRPGFPTFLNIARMHLVKVAQLMKADGSDIGNLSEDVSEEIRKHLDTFAWIRVESFNKAEEYTSEELTGELKKLLRSDLNEEIRRDTAWMHDLVEKERFIEENELSDEIVRIANLSSVFAHWQDMRKEVSLMTTYLNTRYLAHLSKRTGIDEDDLAYADISEMKKVIAGEIAVEVLQKRKKGSLWVYGKEGLEVYPEDEVKDSVDDMLGASHDDVEELKGVAASLGKATGEVKIVVKKADMQKMKQGDVLVSPMTRPEHVPAMKKAAAIVTDEGGVTCHAAVISREMKIPCIVGTRIATKSLKDRDKVEVDADKGIVRRIR
ncbi:hypothetical protein GF351_04660 [Candidatus Woesearchaeota archaeon]|nr:hypothetical protein [Candidatus Woesearchaeota archaeon]